MKAVCFSDTHMTPIPFTLPEADFGIFAGDCCMPGKEAELRSFVKWFSEQPVKHKIFVAGNHDWFTERQPEKTQGAMTAFGIHYLCNSGIELDGINIYGTPIQPFFCNWAWNVILPQDRAAHYANIPDGLDILVTHCPPFGILDWVPRNFMGQTVLENCGCHQLLKAVKRASPRFHVFGHIHCARGTDKAFGTTFINAAICNEEYGLDGRPIEIGLDKPDFEYDDNKVLMDKIDLMEKLENQNEQED